MIVELLTCASIIASPMSKGHGPPNINKENLTNILDKINPALGGLVDGLFNAAELAGELGSKSLNLNGIMSAGRKGVVK